MRPSAHDVAATVLAAYGRPMSAMKLQKLVYYCQAWHVTWRDEPLFLEPIEAWANGPVVVELFRTHRGRYEVATWPAGDPSHLSALERATIESIMATYGPKSAHTLSELTHDEAPWATARAGLSAGARSNAAISLASMKKYYGGTR